MSKHSLIAQILDKEYWKQLNPALHVDETGVLSGKQIEFDPSIIAGVKSDLKLNGYFKLDQILDKELMERLSQGVFNCWKNGWPTPFSVMYDEYWQMFHSLGGLFKSILGSDYKQLPNFWCWYVEPKNESKGWGCHRDRPALNSMHEDGSLDTLTVWIPLTDATVENGCIYVLPLQFDPNYPENLQKTNIADPQNIRALPANKGSILGWTESLCHWGSRSSSKAANARVSISFGYQRQLEAPYETPLLPTNTLPTFEERIGLIAQNVVKYHDHDKLGAEIVDACRILSDLLPPIQVTNGFKREITDSQKRLSALSIWEAQKGNDHRRITDYSYFCELYADLVLAFILDCAEQLDFDQPLHILEIRSETGCFAYRFLNELLARTKRYSRLRNLRIRYALTNTNIENLEVCSQHKRLAPLVKAGVLDFAVFRPDTDNEVRLKNSGGEISKEQIQNPLIVISNYVFNAMKQDAFRIFDGTVKEARYTLYRDGREHDPTTPVLVEHLRVIEEFSKCSRPHYDDPILEKILDHYGKNLPEASILMPVGALQTISNLLSLSKNNLALFAVDKGFTSFYCEKIKGIYELNFAPQELSFDVNFDVIARYFQEFNGKAFATESDQSCSTAHIVLNKQLDLERFNHCFQERIAKRDFANSLSNIEVLLEGNSWEESPDRSSLLVFLSVLQAYSFEPSIFSIAFNKLFEKIAPELSKIDEQQRQEIIAVLKSVSKNVYMIGEEENALDGIFRFYIALSAFDECLLLCQEALEAFGPLTTIIDHTAVCYEGLGLFEMAYKYFHQSVEQVPDHQWARDGLERTKKHLATDKVAGVSTPPA